jgi:protocatechuate 3,4-dioxygenase beta subunit
MKSILAVAGALIAAVVFLWNQSSTANGDDLRRAESARIEPGEGTSVVADAAGAAGGKEEGGTRGTGTAPRDFVFRAVVVDPDGEPVRGAPVGGFVRGHNRREIDLRTGADGEIELDGIAGDRDAALTIRHPDFIPEFAFVPSWSEETTRVVLQRGRTMEVEVLAPDGSPVKNAPYSVSLVRRDGPSWSYWNFDEEGATNDEGRIDLGRVPGIDMDLTVNDPRFEYFTREFDAETLESGRLTVRLRQGGTIRGVVVAPEGEPVEGATVRSAHRSAKTDAEGRFAIAHVSTGGVNVSAEHPDYAAATFGEAVGWRHGVPVRVDDAAEVEGIEIRLAAPTRVTGRVVDEQGQPVAGFEIQSYCSGGFTKAAPPKSGEDGRFVAGPWNIRTPTQWVLNKTKSETHRLAKRQRFDIRPGETLDVGDLVVQSRPELKIRVTMPDGSPVEPRLKAVVLSTLTRRHEERAFNEFLFAQRSEYAVKPDGTLERRVNRAVYTLRARAEGGLQSAAVVVDTAAPDAEEIVLKLLPCITVSGEVRGADGGPEAGVRIALLPADAEIPWEPGAARRTITDREGRFTFHVPEPGDYRIGVPQNASNTKQEFADSPEVRRISVGQEPIEGLRFDRAEERKGALVKGRVVSAETGRPIAMHSLSFVRYKLLFPQHTLMASSWDREGKFRQVLDTPGTYALTIRADDYSSVTTARFEVKAKGEIDLGTIKLPPAFALHGTVEDVVGAPVEYAQVHVLSAGGDRRQSVYTDAQGRFRVTQSDVGVFNLFAVSPRHPVAVMRGVRIGREGSNTIKIKLPAASPLTVRVKDENGRPVAGAEFVYTFPAVAPFTSEEFGGFEPPSYGANETDAEGVVRKPFMPAARLTIQLKKEGFLPVQRRVSTETGKPIELEITLERKN